MPTLDGSEQKVLDTVAGICAIEERTAALAVEAA